jgi:hypothetical protein
MKRRTFIRGALLLVGAGGAGLALYPTKRDYAPKRALKVLDDKRFAILAAVAERTVRAEGADPVEIAHRIDDIFATAVPEAQSDFKQLLWLFENALPGFLLDGRPRPFTRLSPVAKDAALLHWRDSRLAVRKSGYQALRKLTLAAHYSQPTTWASVGYPGPPPIGLAN